MARIRTIKPEFFTSSDILELTPLSRLFYIALWCEADREGLLNWNPKTLKFRYLPADDVEVEDIADELIIAGLILIFTDGDGKEIASIPSFKNHQVINNREADSVIAPRVKGASARVQAEGRKEGKGRERKGKEGKGRENPLVEQKPLDDDVMTIFCYWKKIMESPGSVMDEKRIKLIVNALKNYSPADICKAIRGCSKSPHNMGQNEQKTKYNGLNLILRDAEHIDRFIALDAGNARPASETIEQTNARVMAEFLGADADDDNIIEMES